MVTTRKAERGFALIECLAASLVLTVVAVGIFTGDRGQQAAVRSGFEETVADRLLASRLDELRSTATIAAGSTAFDPGVGAENLPAVACAQTARWLEAGLWEVVVSVDWKPSGQTVRRSATATTWIATEDRR